MSFPVPVFNLLGDAWDYPNKASADPPDYTDVPFQIYQSPHFILPQPQPNLSAPVPYIIECYVVIKAPPTAPLFGRGTQIQPDNSDADYYLVLWRQRCYKGFPQEFMLYLTVQYNADRTLPATY